MYPSILWGKTIDAYAETLDVEGAEKFYREHRDALSPLERDDAVAKIQSMKRARSAEASRQRAEALERRRRLTGQTER